MVTLFMYKISEKKKKKERKNALASFSYDPSVEPVNYPYTQRWRWLQTSPTFSSLCICFSMGSEILHVYVWFISSLFQREFFIFFSRIIPTRLNCCASLRRFSSSSSSSSSYVSFRTVFYLKKIFFSMLLISSIIQYLYFNCNFSIKFLPKFPRLKVPEPQKLYWLIKKYINLQPRIV